VGTNAASQAGGPNGAQRLQAPGGNAAAAGIDALRTSYLDLFVVPRKWDAAGRDVPFYGYNGFDKDGVAKAWLRVSHRELDCAQPPGLSMARAPASPASHSRRSRAGRDRDHRVDRSWLRRTKPWHVADVVPI
jgi:hypothetical protein